MGMYCHLWQVTEADAQRLAGAPGTDVEAFLFGAPPAAPAKSKGVLGWLKSLSPIQVETAQPMSDTPDESRGQARAELDLEKSWHGLHYLLTRTAWEGEEPASFLLKGGADLGEDEIGDSIPRVLGPPQVRAFATLLSQLSMEDLTSRYDPAMMMKLEIYPEIWDNEDDTELEYLLEAFEDLRAFVRQAATDGDAVIVLVS